MNRTSLHPKLQVPYSDKTQMGVEKGAAELSNHWFVVPPSPSRAAPPDLNSARLKRAHGVLQTLATPEKMSNLDRLVLALLVRREALQSSRIEGTFSTIEQVLTPVENFRQGEKSARASVVAYAHALETAVHQARRMGPKVFTLTLLRKLHKELMAKDPDYRGRPGLFRHEIGKGVYVTIGGLGRPENSTFNPAPPKHIKRCLKEHLDWLGDDLLIEMSQAGMAPSLVTRMARSHGHFEAIHPFLDGNGRVGRMLMALQMVTEGYTPLYLSGYIEAKKIEYYRCLQEFQTKLNEKPLIHFVADAIVESNDEALRTKAGLQSLPNLWQSRGNFRADSAALKSLQHLLAHPILSAKELQKLLGVSQPATKRAIDQLQEAKILRERTGLGRNRIYAAEAVIEILARPWGENVETALARADSVF